MQKVQNIFVQTMDACANCWVYGNQSKTLIDIVCLYFFILSSFYWRHLEHSNEIFEQVYKTLSNETKQNNLKGKLKTSAFNKNVIVVCYLFLICYLNSLNFRAPFIFAPLIFAPLIFAHPWKLAFRAPFNFRAPLNLSNFWIKLYWLKPL